MRTITRIAAAALSTTIVVGASASTAFAETTTVGDKASDVLQYADQADERGTQLGFTASKSTGIDLRGMRVKHTTRSVAVNLKFADLDPATTVYVSFRTNGSSTPSRLFINTEENKGVVLNARGTKRCSVPITHRYGVKGSINAVIKRSCLGTPKRIKASAFSADQAFFSDEDIPYLVDPLSPTKVRGVSWSRWLSPS